MDTIKFLTQVESVAKLLGFAYCQCASTQKIHFIGSEEFQRLSGRTAYVEKVNLGLGLFN